MKPIKIAILSLTHGHAGLFLTPLANRKDLTFVAISVAPEDRPKAYLDMVPPGVKIYETDEELFAAHPDLDAAVLGSSNDKHLEQMRLCARHRVHIFSMKIPTFDMDEYDEMLKLVHENNLVCQVELELRMHSPIQRMRSLLESDNMGQLVAIYANNTTIFPRSAHLWMGSAYRSYGKLVHLREGDKRWRGGALADHPHLFDLAQYLTNSEFEYVYADVGPEMRPGCDMDEVLTITGKMKNGVIVSVDPSYSRHERPLPLNMPGWEGYPKRVETNLVLVCENGCIMGDCFAPQVYHTGLPFQQYATCTINRGSSRDGMLDQFVHAIRDGIAPDINLDMHKRTIQVMNACYESISTGMLVRL